MSDWVDYREMGLFEEKDSLVFPGDQSCYLSGEWLAGPADMSYDDVIAAFEATWRARRMPMLRWGA